MNILLIGSGGREHALSYFISRSPKCENLFIAPGNAGTSQCGINTGIPVSDPQRVLEFCRENNIALVTIGPEQPLVEGLADVLRKHGIPVVGPDESGARLEGSKDFAKQFMLRHGIPTAKYHAFHSGEFEKAREYIAAHSVPIVVKASGLAAGKGVVICMSREEAKECVQNMLSGDSFGKAGETVVIEEFLTGIEMSAFILTDGKDYLTLPEAKDYKRIGEGDTGLNTGGMGAVSPVPFADATLRAKIEEKIIRPTVDGLRKEGIAYCGFIFFGLMICDGEPFVIEYNARLGDPETEVILPRIETDILDLFVAAAAGKLSGKSLNISKEFCVTVMLVSGGYPGPFAKGKLITGIESAAGSWIFHAGTAEKDGKPLTSGGRVIAVTTKAETIGNALEISYRNAGLIQFEAKYYRRDIGHEFISPSSAPFQSQETGLEYPQSS